MGPQRCNLSLRSGTPEINGILIAVPPSETTAADL